MVSCREKSFGAAPLGLTDCFARSDSDEEPEEPNWVDRTKQQIADAQPHDDEVSKTDLPWSGCMCD